MRRVILRPHCLSEVKDHAAQSAGLTTDNRQMLGRSPDQKVCRKRDKSEVWSLLTRRKHALSESKRSGALNSRQFIGPSGPGRQALVLGVQCPRARGEETRSHVRFGPVFRALTPETSAWELMRYSTRARRPEHNAG